MKLVRTIISVLFVSIISVLGLQIFSTSRINQGLKKDYAELNHFKYGMFSVQEWKKQLSDIIYDEIENFNLDKGDQKAIQKQLERQLGVLIDQSFKRISRKNSQTPQGFIKQGLLESFIDINEIKKGLPEYARTILKELRRPHNKAKIQNLLKSKISEYLNETFDVEDSAEKKQIVRKLAAANDQDAKNKIQRSLDKNNRTINIKSLIIILLALAVFLLEGFNKGPMLQSQYFILCLTLIVLLTIGVTTPMIDMEAKIAKLSFVLMGHTIQFENQVLYFQSKSIMDVFHIMIMHKQLQMKLVGILMVCFSIVFPVFKMLSSLAYYYDFCRARKYKIIQFFVLKSGKWSMADVLVVAIFMAYIGFNGIINSQLEDLKTATETVNVLTTNGTNLQPGFYLFMSYTFLAMFLASFLKSRPYECKLPEKEIP